MVLYDTIDAMIATIYWLGFSLQHDFNSHKLYAMCGAVGKKRRSMQRVVFSKNKPMYYNTSGPRNHESSRETMPFALVSPRNSTRYAGPFTGQPA